MKLLIVADGTAEDVSPDKRTSLECAKTPFINLLLKKGVAGLFDPRYDPMGVVKTDLVIGSILNIVPNPWPGRAYFEVVDIMGKDYIVSTCAIIRIKFASELSIDQYESIFTTIRMQAMRYGYNSLLRTYERNQSSFLLWNSSNDSNTTSEENFTSFTQEVRSTLHTRACLEYAEVWYGGKVNVNPFKLSPCFIANAIGSLTGLCRSAGFDIIPEAGHPFVLDHQERTLKKAREYILSEVYKLGVLYFKAPDWASHEGDQSIKINVIEFIDKVLQDTLVDLLDSKVTEVLFISDHRTNIGIDSASMNTSIFLMSPFHPNAFKDDKFCERTIEANFVGHPLSLQELGSYLLDE